MAKRGLAKNPWKPSCPPSLTPWMPRAAHPFPLHQSTGMWSVQGAYSSESSHQSMVMWSGQGLYSPEKGKERVAQLYQVPVRAA
eukprot:599063-Pelagomonas_calceolata.AAC.4